MGHSYHTLTPQGSSQKRGEKDVSARLVDDKDIARLLHLESTAAVVAGTRLVQVQTRQNSSLES